MSCDLACSTCGGLRAAALEIVGDGGVEALTLPALERRTGLPPTEIMQHYSTPQECLHETYDEVSRCLLLDLGAAFAQRANWEHGFAAACHRMVELMEASPAKARLCFVECSRGDRELRSRRELTRRLIVEFLANEHARQGDPDGLSELQIELLIGAGFHAISDAVAEHGGRGLPALEPRLCELPEVFKPVAV
jgi:AcrR family transcriptional regulator